MRDVLKQLLTYNDNANCRFIETIRAAEPSSERIITIFSHILNAHRIWNTRIGGVSPTSGVWELHSVERWSDLNCENFDRSKEIIESEALDRMIEYRDTKGNLSEHSL
ncbi:MAG: hypothetical protein HY000_28270 [Planctomycetes bacterium]|nr:hypothetical protein [Planctomycetota bacterium]